MKVKGRAFVSRRHEPIKIERDEADGGPLELVICSASPGFQIRMKLNGLLDYPKPPIDFKRKPGSNDLLLDGARNPIEVELTDDPEYQDKTALVNKRIRALRLREHLQDDPNVEFDSVQPTENNREQWAAYADSLADEITAFGLSDEEITVIIHRGSMLNNGIDTKAVLDSF
jgi:hypothetical protein